MSTSWVAGTVRARALARRRVGAAGARALAGRPDLPAAVAGLTVTAYGHDVRSGQDLAAAQHAVAATLLWHLRVLAGWLPREGADVVRLLAGGFEVANVDELVRRCEGATTEPDYRLGALETSWSRLREAGSLPDLRRGLAASRWGDPGAATARSVHLGMRLAWADRVAVGVPEAAAWARAAAVLLLVRETRLRGRALDEPLRRRAGYVLGPALEGVLDGTLEGALDGTRRPEELWRAEGAWWRRVDREGFALLRRSGFGRAPVVGAVAVLAVDAWRVRAALEVAARGGGPGVLEVFDAVA